jgi:hypothetical protein
MKRGLLTWSCLLFALASLSPILFSQEKMAQAQPRETAKILNVIEHPEGRPYDFVGRTPARVFDAYPFYDINVQVGNQCHLVRYEAQTGYYPSAWQPGSAVQARLGKGVVYLMRYDGEEIPTRILQSCQDPRSIPPVHF